MLKVLLRREEDAAGGKVARRVVAASGERETHCVMVMMVRSLTRRRANSAAGEVRAVLTVRPAQLLAPRAGF